MIQQALQEFRGSGPLQLAAAGVEYSGNYLGDLFRLIADERQYNVSLPLSTRLNLWRKGFTTAQHELFQLDKNNHKDYLSQYHHRRIASRVNRHSSDILDNKIVFQKFMENRHPDLLPELFAFFYGGIAKTPNGDQMSVSEWVRGIDDSFVVKGSIGGQGADVYVVHVDGDSVVCNGERLSRAILASKFRTGNYIVTEVVEQADYADKLYPDSVNTMRIMTLIDSENGDPFIITAVQRIGTKSSAPVDNWSGGGVCADIDEETGELGTVAHFNGKKTLEMRYSHPDTEEKISGKHVPNWDLIRKTMLTLADDFRTTPYIAWDVVSTGEGIRILEANDRPCPILAQVHGGLFEDDRVRRSLYDHC